MPTTVTVVGCGAIGLTSAIRLQEEGFSVTILTRDLPPNLTSAAAGAYWYGGELASHPSRQRWSLASLHRYHDLAQTRETGVALFTMLEVFQESLPDPWFKNDITSFRPATPSEIPAGYTAGFWMEIPIITPPRYLAYLVQRFTQAGGIIHQTEITTLTDIAPQYPLIVNATGVYARQVANDPAVYPLRGQTIRVNAPTIKQAFMDDATFTYVLPREDGCVLGGVSQRDNWNLALDARDRDDIFKRCSSFIPGLQGAPIIAETVGLRPGRYSVRLEKEQVGSATVIHNYGHGGLGFTLSWGCADEVVQLAQEIV